MKKILTSIMCCGLSAIIVISCNKGKEVTVSSVSISQPTAELFIGETVQLNATVLPSDVKDNAVTWTSSKRDVATVSNAGLVTAVAEGTATISASSGGKTGTCAVTVSKRNVAVSSIELNKTSTELLEGESETLVAIVKPDDATDKTVTWSTSDASVVTVDNGKVTAVKEGVASIIATAGGKEAKCSIKVNKKYIEVESITLSPNKVSINKGDYYQLEVTVLPENATDKTVKWDSSDPSIATVENGRITGINKGMVKIIATSGQKRGECDVTITNNIVFANSRVKELCVENWDTDHDGELSYEEAEVIESVGTVFKELGYGGDLIDSFDEFQYFTGVKTLDSRAFAFCSKLKSIILPISIEKIDDECFYYCTSLPSIVLPNKVKSLGNKVFAECTILSNITLNEGLVDIGNACFGATGIKTIIIPSTVSSMGINMFVNCQSLETIRIPDTLLLDNTQSFFSKCTSLKDVYLGKGVTRISEHCFQDCVALESVQIAGAVSEIKFEAFSNCSKLESIVLPSSLSKIGYWAFRDCISLQSITIPSAVLEIEKQCFSGCEKLTRVDMSQSRITYLYEMVFAYCSSLSEVLLPEGLEVSTNQCFIGCPSLKKLTFPTSYKEMETFIGGAINAEEIVFQSINPPTLRGYYAPGYDFGKLRESYSKIKVIYVPAGAVESYKTTAPWSAFEDLIKVSE